LTNIADYQKYIFNNDGVNRLQFKKFYDTALSLKKEIDIFRLKNLARFQKYDGFMALFGKINDEFNMLDNALKDPNKITSELIEKKINLGDYQFVFVNLSAKLEIILKNKYELDGTLSSMLSNARKSGKIKKEVINDLHDFRENRNANIHPEDRTADYTADDLRRWSKEIFDLEEKNK
jgi:archaellum component FlaC